MVYVHRTGCFHAASPTVNDEMAKQFYAYDTSAGESVIVIHDYIMYPLIYTHFTSNSTSS